MVMVMMITLWLVSKGYLQNINKSHLHDMGKWIFAVSILWTYLFFSQYMLYWYSNIPEEIAYFLPRVQDYAVPFWGMIIINFLIPTLMLMSKDMKRNPRVIVAMGIVILIGHWIDTYLLIVPGAMQDGGKFGFIEIGMFLGYLGLYLFVTFSQMAKAPLQVGKNNPLLDESLHHHIN
jgi:Ni/Fe-hydrogenase subunit HybB-like protein